MPTIRRRPLGKSKTHETLSVEAPQITSNTEMGYLWLYECAVYLPSAITKTCPLKQWLVVDLLEDDTIAGGEEQLQGDHDNHEHQPPCSHCNLIFHHQHQGGENGKEEQLKFNLRTGNVGRFQGIAADMFHRPLPGRTDGGTKCREKRRSDAVLLVGSMLDAQDHGYLKLQSLQILLHESDTNQDRPYSKAIVSLVATLAFPSLAQSATENRRSATRNNNSSKPLRLICPHSRRNVSSSNLKLLPASMQMILSLVQSDWGCFNSTMRHLECSTPSNKNSKKKKDPDFFPPKLTLEELYLRIRGSSSKSRLPKEETEPVNMSTPDNSSLWTIPCEILNSNIALFLQAKSLDSLRCTCKSLHKRLDSVVPGLKLQLFQHQIKSLQWMRQREIRPLSEGVGQQMLEWSSRHGATSTLLLNQNDSDPIRAMTGGQSAWLCPRWGKEEGCEQSLKLGLRINQMTGCEIASENDEEMLARQGARGGLLCDDPGLGKTITILALVLQTVGLSTEQGIPRDVARSVPSDDPGADLEHASEEQMFKAYWREDITKEFRHSGLCRVMSRLKRLDPSVGLFFRPINPQRDGCEDYFDVIKQPICFNDIYKKISAMEYGADNCDFNAFVFDVELCFRNATEYNPPEHEVHMIAKALLHRFQKELLVQFKKDQLGSLRSSASNVGLKPNSSVAVLMQKKSEKDFNKSLLHSSSTLIVIPPVLMDHWQEQIQNHVDFSYVTRLIPLVYEYTPARKSALGLEEALRLCQVDKTHFPLIFIDKAGTHKLPSPEFLAMFMIVITTTRRFTNEWKNGSFQEELVRNRSKNDGSERDGRYVNYRLLEYGSADEEACPILKVNWLRICVDEGHAMGRGKSNSAIRFASWISAQRRWAMTGTPTQQTASQNGINNMHGLMRFLQHDFFSGRRDGDKLWKKGVARSWKEEYVASFFRLRSLLTLLMIRHTKLDIAELPLPIYNTTVVEMSPLEITTYNTLVSAVQGNLKLTSMKGKTSGQQDSLLNRSQAKHAQLALTNIRRVCCGGTRILPVVTHANWIEFIQMCMLEHQMPQDKVQEMEQYLQQTTTEQLSRCYCCGMLLSMLLVLPCGCLLCTECTDNESNVCVICDRTFDVDEFQKLQPGLDYKWLQTDENLDGSKKDQEASSTSAAENPQNGETNIAERAGEDVRVDAGQDQVLLRPPQERRRTRRPGDGHECEYNQSFEKGKCTLCFEPHNHCKLVNSSSSCPVCYQKAQECPKSESKAHYLVDTLVKLYAAQQEREKDFTRTVGFTKSSNWRPMKVIVFSQFRETLNVVGDRLLRRLGTACVAEYWGKYRTSELHKFIHDPDCFVMLLGKDGSEGLDLSFVTHLFFLEAIWDKSLEQQAVARAWRMGATGPVQVETLLAKRSVEEQMENLEDLMTRKGRSVSDMEGGRDKIVDSISRGHPVGTKGGGTDSFQRGKVQFLLKSLTLLPDIELAPLSAPEQVLKRFGFDAEALNPIDTSHQVREPPLKRRKLDERRVRFS